MATVPNTTFGNILIPLITTSKQKKISDLIKQSFGLRKEARTLLAQGKHEFEELIERGT